MIKRSGCIGCGLCAETCPEVFEMAEDGLAEVCGIIKDEVTDVACEAAENCPVGVIHIKL